MIHYFSRPCNALKSKCICTVHRPKRKKRKKKKKRYSGHINVQSIVAKSEITYMAIGRKNDPRWSFQQKRMEEKQNAEGKMYNIPTRSSLPWSVIFIFFVLNTRTSFLWKYDTRYVINSRIPLWRQSTITDRNVSARHRGHMRAHGGTICFAGGYLSNPLKLLFL